MKLVLVMILLAVAFPGLILANLQELAAAMPRCGVSIQFHIGMKKNWLVQLNCMISSIAVSNCAATDQACICTDATLTTSIEICVAANCTVRDSLSTLIFLALNISRLTVCSEQKCVDNSLRSTSARPYKGSVHRGRRGRSYSLCSISSSNNGKNEVLWWWIWVGRLDNGGDHGMTSPDIQKRREVSNWDTPAACHCPLIAICRLYVHHVYSGGSNYTDHGT